MILSAVVTGLRALSLVCQVCLGAFSAHSFLLLFNALFAPRPAPPPEKPGQDYEWPFVTVQLPIYNERFNVKQLLASVARLRYQEDRLEIQVLDDSTDDTSDIVREEIRALKADGCPCVEARALLLFGCGF